MPLPESPRITDELLDRLIAEQVECFRTVVNGITNTVDAVLAIAAGVLLFMRR